MRVRLARIAVAMIGLLVTLGPRWADAQGAPAIEEVRRAYAQCREIQGRATSIDVYETRASTPAAPRWQRGRPPEGEGSGRAMSLYTADGTIRMAFEKIDALSGDWRQRIQHCFRADGSLAFVFSVLRTFQGDVQVEDRLYFDPQGKRIRTNRRSRPTRQASWTRSSSSSAPPMSC